MDPDRLIGGRGAGGVSVLLFLSYILGGLSRVLPEDLVLSPRTQKVFVDDVLSPVTHLEGGRLLRPTTDMSDFDYERLEGKDSDRTTTDGRRVSY